MKINIAVVDDHILFRSGLVSLLKDYDDLKIVIQASNGKELINALKSQKADVILLDLQMPEMNGMETTRALRESYPEVKIIILTMHHDEEFIFDLMSKGANGFIPKNTGVDIVIKAIHCVIDSGYYYDDQITQALIKGNSGNIKALDFLIESTLTEREIEVIKLICAQKSNKEIAEILAISPRTVDTHKNNIFLKTGAKNIIGVALFAVQSKLIN